MSKKLIAVASAAALALSALAAPALGAPVSAGSFAVQISTKVAGSGADATTNAITVNVPTEDVIRADAATTDTTAVTFGVDTTTATGAVSVSSTGGIKLLTATQLADVLTDSTSGTQTLSLAAVSSEAEFYAFTTSTTAGTVTISNGGNTAVYYVKGVSAKGYKMTVSGPSVASNGVAYEFTAVVSDMFGNPTTGLASANFVATGLGAFTAAPAVTRTETATKGTYKLKLGTGDVASSGAGLLSVVLTTAIYAEAEASFGKRVSTATLSVNSSDPSVTIAALTASVAALTADYNALAVKFNKKVKKAKNKVALK
jgi:hypothetical protein